jgi:hypothetical protein
MSEIDQPILNFENIRNILNTETRQMNNVFNIFNQTLIDEIERFVPLEANPNRTMDMSGNLIKVVTQSGSIYCFEIRSDVTCRPIYFNHRRIRVSTTDESGNTISNLNGDDLYRIDLQGNVIWRNESLLDISGNNIHNISYINNINNIQNINNIHNNYYNYTSQRVPDTFWRNDETLYNIDNRTTYSGTGNRVTIFNGTIIRKKIIEDNICPIRFEPIEEYDIYMNCTCCKKNFFEDELREWLLPKSLSNKTCPSCRSQWTDYNMYINRE